ncbi:MAG TPA: N-acetylmuramoyl-L-alanine amidase [Kofleriaceae bacterium]|nr:N-acetylmuramoyl-L-alanine amidase [Kofleriaceae bacterium]
MNRTAAAALVAILSAAGLGACTTDVTINDGISAAVVTDLDRDFDQAAADTGVPSDLLKAIGYVETRWEMVAGAVENDGQTTGVGVMDLSPEMVARGAALAGLGQDEVEGYAASNIEAAAHLLAEEAQAQGVSGDDLMAWMPVVEAWTGIVDDDARASYIHDGVLRVLREGAHEEAESGESIATIRPHGELPSFLTGSGTYNVGTADYADAVWRPSPNFGSRPAGTAITMVVIHTCEGNYAGCWGWLRQTQAQASAHYVVNESGSEITQLVREASRAWHVAATYDCSRNGQSQCGKNGVSVNNFAIGIEHAGFGSQATWANGLIEASAKLTCDITRDHDIPRDRNHIVGHGQLQPWNRTDPGPNWPWAHYIDRVRTICGDDGGGGGGGGGGGTPPPAAIIVDSNNANNDASVARIELSGTWTSASATPGYYGSGYWFADTGSTASPATFFFYLPSAQSRVVEAWWTQGTNRSTAATFTATDASGAEVGRAVKNQQTAGSQWVTLGTWQFSAGWNKVALSRQAASGKVVIADAIRVR